MASIKLNYDSIPENIFDYDEVEKLNAVDGLNVEYGSISEKKVAIIGLPKGQNEITEVVDKYDKKFVFVPVKKEEKEKGHYVVYPFNQSLYDNIPLIECVEEIVALRAIEMYKSHSR